MNEIEKFKTEVQGRIKSNSINHDLKNAANTFLKSSIKPQYSYNFSWLGRPIIQYPQDIVALQEIIWKVKPDFIIETGIAHGGSLILTASLLELLSLDGEVLGIDIDIRSHNKKEIEKHPMYHRISMLEGSSIDTEIVQKVHYLAKDKKKIMVILDSNHTHYHVQQELQLYSTLVSKGSYLIVFDTLIEDMDSDAYPDRPWGKGDNPKTAVHEFLKSNDSFEIDKSIQDKLLITVAPDGYLKRVK